MFSRITPSLLLVKVLCTKTTMSISRDQYKGVWTTGQRQGTKDALGRVQAKPATASCGRCQVARQRSRRCRKDELHPVLVDVGAPQTIRMVMPYVAGAATEKRATTLAVHILIFEGSHAILLLACQGSCISHSCCSCTFRFSICLNEHQATVDME
eukprot:557747-Amphidinium_carterae.1